MQDIRDAILSGDRTEQTYAALPLPATYRGVTVHKDEVDLFEGLETRDKDPRRSLHVDDVPLPELAPGEALVAVMASGTSSTCRDRRGSLSRVSRPSKRSTSSLWTVTPR